MPLSKFIKFHNYVFEDLLIGIHSTQGLAATAKDEVHSVYWGINPPQKHHRSFLSRPLSTNSPSPQFLGNPLPLYIDFS